MKGSSSPVNSCLSSINLTILFVEQMASFLFLFYSQDKTGNSLSVKQAMAIKKSNQDQERNRVTKESIHPRRRHLPFHMQDRLLVGLTGSQLLLVDRLTN